MYIYTSTDFYRNIKLDIDKRNGGIDKNKLLNLQIQEFKDF